MALGSDCNCGILITLDDCRHLDDWCWIDWWGDLVIVSAPNQGYICEGFLGLFPDEVPKATLVNCLCHWVTSLVGRFLRRPFVGLGLWNTYQPSKHQVLVDTTGTSVPANTWTSGEKSYVNCDWNSPSDSHGIHIMIGSSLFPRWYNHPIHSLVFTFDI